MNQTELEFSRWPRRKARTAVLLTLLGLLLPPPGALAGEPPFDAIYAFGDSLTDTGREPAEPYLHYKGRWSNGPLWIEYLSQRFGIPYDASRNFAESGAQCNDTFGQVRRFTPTNDISRALFVVWAGGNDFLQEYDTHWISESGWDWQTAYSVGEISNAVVRLQSLGARTILVPNTVDVTKIPTIRYLAIDGFTKFFVDYLRDYLRSKVKLFNERLAIALERLRAAHPEVRIVSCNFYGHVNAMLRDATLYGFTETRMDALADVDLLDKSFDGPGANYVFWDPIHPTTKAHAAVADWFHAALVPMIPELKWEPAGDAGLQLTGLHLGETYVLEQSADCREWNAAETFMAVTNSRSVSIRNDSPSAFFRVRWARTTP